MCGWTDRRHVRTSRMPKALRAPARPSPVRPDRPRILHPRQGRLPARGQAGLSSCAVRVECLNDALDNDERFRVWGGLSESERRKLKDNRDATEETTPDQTHSAEAPAAVHHPEGTAGLRRPDHPGRRGRARGADRLRLRGDRAGLPPAGPAATSWSTGSAASPDRCSKTARRRSSPTRTARSEAPRRDTADIEVTRSAST